MIKRNCRFSVVVGLCVAIAGVSHAQIVIRDSSTVNKFSISLASLKVGPSKNAAQCRGTLESDLVRSGWFKVVKANASVDVTGSCSQNGTSVVVSGAVKWAVGAGVKSAAIQISGKDPVRVAHQVSDAITRAVTGQRGMADSRILLIGSRSGKKEIYICDSDGARLTQLTNDKSVALAPAWGANGESFVYTSFKNRFPAISLVDLRTRKIRGLPKFPGLNTAGDISSSGRDLLMTLSRDGNPEIYILDMKNFRSTRVTRTRDANEASPVWSPDGRQIAYVSDSRGSPHIYISNRDGSGRRLLTKEGRENVSPDWGPKGIVYASRRFGRYHIYVIDPVTGVSKQLTKADVDHENPSWAPDGRHVVFGRTQGFHTDLYVLDTMGDPQVRLTRLQGDWYSPAWSP